MKKVQLQKANETIYPKATRKECIRALEHILEHGELSHPNSFEMDKIKRV